MIDREPLREDVDVFHEVDEGLRLLMKAEALQGSDVEVVFDAPTKDWASRRNTPTIDVYLYDIREELDRRSNGPIEVRDTDGIVTQRLPPPRWYKLSYLVTAWTQRPEDEHRLLAACLAAFIKHDFLPTEYAVGSIGALGLRVPVLIGYPPPQDRSISDVWTALGGELKPSLDLVVTAPTATGVEFFVGPPLLEAPTFGVRPVEGPATSARRAGNGHGGGSDEHADVVAAAEDAVAAVAVAEAEAAATQAEDEAAQAAAEAEEAAAAAEELATAAAAEGASKAAKTKAAAAAKTAAAKATAAKAAAQKATAAKASASKAAAVAAKTGGAAAKAGSGGAPGRPTQGRARDVYAAREGRAPSESPELEPEPVPSEPEETIKAGGPGERDPGRMFRIRGMPRK